MDYSIDDKSTKKSIVFCLKKSGGMSIDDLSREINITPMGIRQHLLSLEKKGIVTYKAKRQGIGRPGYIYMLTDTADEFFPNKYDDFAVDMLKDIRKNEGQEQIEKIFGWRKERALKQYRSAVGGSDDFDETLRTLHKFLLNEGHFVDLSRNNGHYHLKQYHCPIKKIAGEFREACRYELMMYRELLGRDVKRDKSVSDGDICCLYVIPRA